LASRGDRKLGGYDGGPVVLRMISRAVVELRMERRGHTPGLPAVYREPDRLFCEDGKPSNPGVSSAVNRSLRPQLTGYLRRWWRVLGSNQRRLSRRFTDRFARPVGMAAGLLKPRTT
jgi:hypothetical protein